MGRHLITGANVCCDPVSWFTIAKLITNPSEFVLGLPGFGKSSQVRHQLTGQCAFGDIPMVLGDLKPDYVELCQAMEGQVLTIGRGRGYLNILDPGDTYQAVKMLHSKGFHKEANGVAADAHGRALSMLCALIEIYMHEQVSGTEKSILDAVLKVLNERPQGEPPTLPDVFMVIQSAPDPVRARTLDYGDLRTYQQETRRLEKALMGLIKGSHLGETFCQRSSVVMDRHRMIAYDISNIAESETDLAAATLLACWSQGFAAVNLSHVLADCGLEERRVYVPVQDELWRAVKVGPWMVDRMDGTTRLNRQDGTAPIKITHTMKDLVVPNDPAATEQAMGFVERSGIVICGALPDSEMARLNQVRRFTRPEQDMMVSWQNPGPMDRMGRAQSPPGVGRFMIKVGGRPGIPVQVQLTDRERPASDTNKRWAGVGS
ncbi:MAG: ATP/GTP-binding protein [Propionibacteriaceae bacterium]|nr:ATP/GTP-binding protein [Propionibacteriaceae bacterium]